MFRRKTNIASRASLLWMLLALCVAGPLHAQPPNDLCANASTIVIGNNNWAFGSFVSDTNSFLGAGLETGEYVHPAQVAQDKSMWYKFTLPTTRLVRIILRQPGPPFAMNAGDAGWTLFRTGNCLPGAADVVDPPILNIEGYTHECLKAGEYLLQVSGIFSAIGDVYVELQVAPSPAPETQYDYASAPYDFGLVSGITLGGAMNHYYEIGCHSIFEQETRCPDSTYTQSTWHTFTTDNYVDYVRFEMTESPWNPFNTGPRNFGYVLYEGNCILDSIPDNGPGLTTIDSCKMFTINSQNQYEACWYNCQLQPNTTYSIQLLAPTSYTGRVNVRMYEVGGLATAAPYPPTIPAGYQYGVLPYNTQVTTTDYFACNSVLSQNLCGSVVPDTVWRGSTPYDMNTWLTFEVPAAANVDLRAVALGCQPGIYARVFRGDVTTGGCNLPLDTTFVGGLYYRCMPPGQYSVQLLGRYRPSLAHTCASSVGKGVQFRVRVDQVAPMAFGLFTPQEVDSINNWVPLPSSTTLHNAQQDYFDCRTTVLPAGDVCGTQNDRAMYRVVNIGQNGILTVGGGVWTRFRYRLYRGNATTEPIVANRIQNLVDQVGCQSLYWPFKLCVTPGYYTLVTFGDITDVNFGDSPWFRFEAFPPTQFTDPNNPEVLDTLGNANASISSTPARFDCNDNPLTILGYAPCNNATKQVYREFYLDSPQLVTFTQLFQQYYVGGTVRHRIFTGRISNGTLTGLHRDCHSNWTECMQPGWYTVVSYGIGETFASPTYTSGLGGSIGDRTSFTLTVNPNTQRYGTFATAEQVNGGNPIFWEPDYPGGHTQQIPRNHKTYTLGTEYWDCSNNLPFPAGITPCLASHNRLSYRVFNLTKPSMLHIDGLNPWPYNHQSRLYAGDITSQSAPFTVVQDCINDDIHLCIQPGVYTLVTFAGDVNIGRTMTPTIYLDSLGTSKFDHANLGYDFGNIPNTSIEYRGNLIDPPGPFGRAPSNDFIFCSTTAQVSDPDNVCPNGTPPPGPSLPASWNPRQNLWYTFEVTGPGYVDVSVYNLTPGKPSRSPFAVYRAPNTTFPPADSTIAQGLQFVATSTTIYCGNRQTVTFYRDPCLGSTTDRYYILVDRWAGSHSGSASPNTQLEVGVEFRPAPGVTVLYDHYSQANVINGNPTLQCNPPYIPDTLMSGTYTGCIGNLNCATRDPTDQNSCGTRTLWYTFEVGLSGKIRINYDRPGPITTYNANDIQLYRSVVTGDSTSSGLVRVPLTGRSAANPDFNFPTVYSWGEGCMQPGRYYIMFTGCNFPTETVIPRIWLLPEPGDLCTDPIIMNIDSAGSDTARLNVDCLTIGEAPGEDGSNMGCLDGPVGYKSAWFQINLNDTTTKYDVDVEIDEFTTVTGNLIKYRIGYGDCNAMTFDNCVSDGTFIILNLKCREAGSFWVQVTMPDFAQDSIRLNITATPVPDTACLPIDPLKPRANFDIIASCQDIPVVFQNNSTTGPGVTYTWDFGDGFGSTLQNPVHQYAVADTYLVSLIVSNGTDADTLIRPVIIYPRPQTNFTCVPNSPAFVGDSICFTNLTTDTIPTSTFYWNFCSGQPPCGANLPSYVGSTPPKIVYSQPGWKTVCLSVVNGNCDSTFCKDIFISDTTIFAGGPYDGHAVATLGDSCEQTEQNVFAGGPYDGHGDAYLTDTCTSFITNVYAGGPYDGHTVGFLTDSCPNPILNVYSGGPYDGHSFALLTDTCLTPSPNVFAGGPYDGHAVVAISDSCSFTYINIYAGGPYDGHDNMDMYCDTIPLPPVDTNSCDTCFYAGGPYDGAAVAAIYTSCAQPPNVFAGGPYDGHTVATLSLNCPPTITQIYAGGPYDGHDAAYYTDSCATFNINVFAGGPYDGHDNEYYTDSCSNFVINIFAGGPYDGSDTVRRVPNNSTPFTATDDTICVGSAATFLASAATNWFSWNGSQYVWEGGVTNSFTTPVFFAPGIYTYWADNPYSCEKIMLTALVLDTLAGPDFVWNQNCLGDSTFFTNQTVIPGPPNASFGGSGFPIGVLGPTGIPPGPGQLSFSSQQYLTYPNLYNGVNDQHNGWTAGNGSGPSTQWAQWTYLTPKSVNRFYYWPRNNCCGNKAPTQLRLYYDDGSGWVLAKLWTTPNPSTADFDTGTFFETANVYATRWKLEMDVLVANAPSWGEFQVFASDPAVGGNTSWNFGDGGTSSVQDPSHLYGAIGTYNVTLTVDVPGFLCVNNVVKPVTIDGCGILPLTRNLLSGRHRPDQEVNALTWDIEGTFDAAELLKWTATGWTVIHSWESTGAPKYFYDDPEIVYGTNNLYQVRAFDREGNEQLSNQVNIFVERPQALEVILFPNPVNDHTAGFLLKLPADAMVEIEIYDLLGHRLVEMPRFSYVKGIHRLHVDVSRLPAATYLAVVRVNGQAFTKRMVVLGL